MEKNGCRFMEKGCLNVKSDCGNGYKAKCVQAVRQEELDLEKCPVLDGADGCDISNFRLIMAEQTGNCYDGKKCRRAFFPEEFEASGKPNPNWADIAKKVKVNGAFLK